MRKSEKMIKILKITNINFKKIIQKLNQNWATNLYISKIRKKNHQININNEITKQKC